jgi:hypothetical protein
MGAPSTLTREQVRTLADKNDGKAEAAMSVEVPSSGMFLRDISFRENDVCLVLLQPIRAQTTND